MPVSTTGRPAAVMSILVTANTRAAQANLAALDRQMAYSVHRANVGTQALSRAITGLKFVAVGSAAALAGSVAAAVKYEQSFADVRKTVEATEPQFKKLEQGFLDMSKTIPDSAGSLAELAGEAGALGIEAKKLEKFTKTAAQLGTTTEMSSMQAADVLARLGNIMDDRTTKSFRRMGATLVDLGNKGASTEDEIGNMSLRIAGAGKQVGLTTAQVLGLAAGLANLGIRTEMGGSAISRVMLAMQAAIGEGGKELERWAEVAGMSVEEFKRKFEKDVPGTIAAFTTGLAKLKEEGVPAATVLQELGEAARTSMNDIRVRDTLLRVAGNTKEFVRGQTVANTAWKENIALTEEAQQRYNTLGSQLSMLKNTIEVQAITLGTKFLPDLKELVAILRDPKITMDERIQKVGDKLGEMIAKWLPRAIEAGAKIGANLLKGIGNAFLHASPLGKTAIGLAMIRFVGGKGAIMGAGVKIAQFLGVGMAAGMGAGAAGGAAAGVGGAAAGAGAAMFENPLKKGLANIRWARVGAGAAGVTLATYLMEAMERHALRSSDDIRERIMQRISDLKGDELQQFFKTWTGPYLGELFGSEDLEAARQVADLADSLQRVADAGGQLNTRQIERYRDVLASFDLPPELVSDLTALYKLAQGPEADNLQETLARVRDRFDEAFDLKSVRSALAASLLDINSNVEKGGGRIRDATRETFFAARDAILQAAEDGEIGWGKAQRAINRLMRRFDIKPAKATFEGVGQSARRAFAGVEQASGKARSSLDDDQNGIRGTNRKLGQSFSEMSQDSRRAFAGVDQASGRTKNELEDDASNVRHTNRRLGQSFSDMRQDARRAFAGVDDASGKTKKGVRGDFKDTEKDSGQNKRSWDRWRRGVGSALGLVGDNVVNLENVIHEGLQMIGDKTDKALKAYNVKPTNLKLGQQLKPKQKEKFYARGGPINLGAPVGDSVPAMLEKGEYVLNRNAVKAIGQAQLDEINFGAAKRFQAGGSVLEALGPYDIPPISYDPNHAGGNSHVHIAMQPESALVSLGRQLQGMGFMISGHPKWGGAAPGVHSANSYHYRNLAIDVNSAADETRAEVSQIAKMIGGKGGGALFKEIARIMVEGADGKAKELAQSVLDKTRNAANKYIASKVPTHGVGNMSADGDVERIFAQVSRRLSQSKTATLALGMAGYAESGMRDLDYGDSTSKGALQLLSSTAAGLGVSPHDEGAIASLFYTTGFYGRGGANKLADSGLPAHLVAQNVQGSAFSSGSNYLAQKGPALNWMQRFGLRLGGLVGMQQGGPVGMQSGGLFSPEDLGLAPGDDFPFGKPATEGRILKLYDRLMGTSDPKKRRKIEREIKKMRRELKNAQKKRRRKKVKRVKKEGALQNVRALIDQRQRTVDVLNDKISGLQSQFGFTEQRDVSEILTSMGLDPDIELSTLTDEQRAVLEGQAGADWQREEHERATEAMHQQVLLSSLMSLRAQLINGIERAEERAAAMKKRIEKLWEEEKAAKKKARQLQRDIDKLQKQIKKIREKEPPKKKDGEKASDYQERLKKWRRERQRNLSDLGDKVGKKRFRLSQARNEAQTALETREALRESRDTVVDAGEEWTGLLEGVQGIAATDSGYGFKADVKLRPYQPGGSPQFTGEILPVQQRLWELGVPTPKIEIDYSGEGGIEDDDSELARLLQEKLLEVQRQRNVLEAQMPVFKDFAGLFATGGFIPPGKWGITGEAGPEVTWGPMNVAPLGPVPSAAAAEVRLTVVVEDGAVDAKKIKAYAQEAFNSSRSASRRMIGGR
jgi:TP901 family phage tail tape measure protein